MADSNIPAEWRVATLPGGRRVEFVRAEWAPSDGTEEPGSIAVNVTVLIAGGLHTCRVLLTSEQIEEACHD